MSGGERQRLELAARMGDELAAANTAADGSLEWEYLVWVGTRS